jgi:predicted nucleic acid-binding protein
LIAVDTNAFIHFAEGIRDERTELIQEAFEYGIAYLPPVVVTELLSDPALTDDAFDQVSAFPLLSVTLGYWNRAGALRADLVRQNVRAGVADCLIAQSCIDYDIPLITYDRDFRHFVRAGLKFA